MSRRTALLIAYHFPPCHGSSGMQRTLRFAQHLPSFGWQPIVLTIAPHAYDFTVQAEGNEVPSDLPVCRAFGLDTARHLSLFGRYPSALALPDRWRTWRYWAVPAALRLIREYGIEVIWSTFPIATAHHIGLEVVRRSGLPWIAEFRDPMWQGNEYPTDPRMNKAWKDLEAAIVKKASLAVLTTPGAASEYATRYPEIDRSRLVVIENGYDEETFQRASAAIAPAPMTLEQGNRPITLLHSGVIYRSERDPTQLFAAIASLKNKGLVSAHDLRLVLRASGNDSEYGRMLDSLYIRDIVRLAPAIDYLAAIREMLTVDGLLILQASNCNSQVPAKLYEYLRANRPILALTDPHGETARALRSVGLGNIAPLDSAEDIARKILELIEQIRHRTWRPVAPSVIESYSRKTQSGRLAQLMLQLYDTPRLTR